MKKYLVIIFIFLTGFIFAGANASRCNAVHDLNVKFLGKTFIANTSIFLDFENKINKENIINLRSNLKQENSRSFNPQTFICFENNNKYIFYDKQYTLLSFSASTEIYKDIKYNLHPRAP